MRKYRSGEFKAAMAELVLGFNITSLKRHFDPIGFAKAQKKKEKAKAQPVAA